MKAWIVGEKYSFASTIVFAETRGKAKNLARYTDACEDADFCDIEARRLSKADKYYKEGKTEMDWNDPKDRRILVEEFNFRCEYVELDVCEKCSAREYCDEYEEYIDAYAGEDTDEQ